MLAGAGGRSGTIPAEGASGAGLGACEFGNGFSFKNRDAAVKPAIGKKGDVIRGGEESGVSGNAVHYPCVLVVDFALDDSVAKILVVASGDDLRFEFCGWTKASLRHAERLEDFASAKLV